MLLHEAMAIVLDEAEASTADAPPSELDDAISMVGRLWMRARNGEDFCFGIHNFVDGYCTECGAENLTPTP